MVYNYRYVTLTEVPNGLVITLTPEGREEIDLTHDAPGEWQVISMLEEPLCNGWDLLPAEEIGALTSTQLILSNDVLRDDNGYIMAVGEVYWHANYQVQDPWEALLSLAGLFLHRGGE